MGPGVRRTHDDIRFDGEWHDGVQNDPGVITHPDGMRIEGQMRGTKPDGTACIIRRNGERTCGTWRDGQMVSVD